MFPDGVPDPFPWTPVSTLAGGPMRSARPAQVALHPTQPLVNSMHTGPQGKPDPMPTPRSSKSIGFLFIGSLACLVVGLLFVQREPGALSTSDSGRTLSALMQFIPWAISTLGFIGSIATVLSLLRGSRRDQAALASAQETNQRVEQGLSDHLWELQGILDAVPGFVYYKDDKNTILELNKMAAESIGIPRTQIRGRATSDFFPESAAAEFLRDDLEVLTSRTPKLGIIEVHETQFSGARKVRTDKIPLRGPSGEYDRLVAIATDITALEQARADLIELQQRFERATEGSSDGLWDYDPATAYVWYSDRFKSHLGYTPERYHEFEPTWDAWTSGMHPEDREELLIAVEATMQANVPLDVQYRSRMASGEYLWFRARGHCRRDAEGTAVWLSGSITNIHDQRQAESRLSLAMRAAQIGLWDWNVTTGETFFSDTFYTMLGYEPGELKMCLDTWKHLCHPDDIESAMADIEEHIQGRAAVYSNEHRLLRKDGSYSWIRDVGEVVERDHLGAPTRLIGVHLDVQENHLATERAEAANQAKSEFLANMSHEIRTPMTAILGYADLLVDEAGNPVNRERSLEVMQTIRSNGNHLLAIINDILDLSKIDAGMMTTEHIETDPALVVEGVLELVQSKANEQGVALSAEYLTPIPRAIESDPTRLRQILLNLVGNAIKFTKQGSVSVRVSYDKEDCSMDFEVVDTGIGLSSEQVRRLLQFDAFVQADGSTTRKFGGTGIGLRISNSLAKMLGGEIRVTSEPGKGSAFAFRVATGQVDNDQLLDSEQARAAGRRSDEPSAASKAESNRPLEGALVLIAEDTPVNMRLVSIHLERAGASVLSAVNGAEAVDLILELHDSPECPDLVLMDMQMPVLDGYGATQQIRAAGIRELPIVALTANAMSGDREKCMDAGCDDFLSKPIDKIDLIETCSAWIAGRGEALGHRRTG